MKLESFNQKGLSPVFALLTAVAMLSVTGLTIKYVNDGQKEVDNEIAYQEELVAESNREIIKKEVRGGRPEGGESSGWLTYRNNDHGFEVKYPDYFPVKENFPASEGNKFACGEQLGDSFRAASNEHFDPTIFDFTVYSNPQKLAAKDFFLCLMKDTRAVVFSENEINDIKTVSVGNRNAASFAWDTAFTAVFVPYGDKFIEIVWQKGQSSDANPGEFEQVLSSFKFTN